jgi:hypothetical protein
MFSAGQQEAYLARVVVETLADACVGVSIAAVFRRGSARCISLDFPDDLVFSAWRLRIFPALAKNYVFAP